ncbi:sodium:solute symporter family protein [Hornefia butyriciproducens]|uniref:sodium:solute symporter family protein n=1 Tax=Hornefia butyriciproducens TaxID=2652293 RepID=UPI002A90C2D9|nr:sodium:solute symporter family protein [Hornefia butyriciproducens]MDY5463081.1 sodium:solute symporter family protein [Hornefia butyriciproducens]
MGAIDYTILVVYMAGMLLIGFIAKGRINSMDDFILGGRRFNRFALVGTILATMVGSGMTMGAAGDVYSNGATGSTVWVYLGFAIGLITLGFMSKAIRETNARSLAEVVSKSFGTHARLAAAIVVVCYAVALVAINIAGLRTILIYIFGEHFALSIPVATVLAAAIAITYTAMGGFYAVVWTDVAQLLIMIVGVFIIGPIVGIHAIDGGFASIQSAYDATGSSITEPLKNGFSQFSIGYMLSYFLACPGDPTMPQRVLSARDDATSKFSFITSGCIAIYFGIAMLALGGSIFVLMPNIEATDSALPAFVMNYYPPIIKGITMAGLIAAIMSSFDSFLILSTTHIMYDIGRVINPKLKDEIIQKSLPVLTVALGIAGIIVALFITSLLSYLAMVFSVVGAALVPVLFASLYFKTKTSKKAATASIIVGALIPAILYLTVGYNVPLGDPVFIGLASSVIVIIVGSLFLHDKPTREEIEENMKRVG